METLLDPVEDAYRLCKLGKKAEALAVIRPVLIEIKSTGGYPSPTIQALLEDLVIYDALTYGVTP